MSNLIPVRRSSDKKKKKKNSKLLAQRSNCSPNNRIPMRAIASRDRVSQLEIRIITSAISAICVCFSA